MAWDFKKYGTAEQPIHKSDLNSITGDYGCLRAFRYQQEERAKPDREDKPNVSGKAAGGTAAHETIARALENIVALKAILSGATQTVDGVRKVFLQEMDRAIDGREVAWYKDDAEDVIAERVEMIVGLLNNLRKHVAEVIAVESGFIVNVGGYWLSGFVDLIYRPQHNPNLIALSDWKTGATKPHPIELDHGWESGIYGSAVHSGVFLPRNTVAVTHNADGSWTAKSDYAPDVTRRSHWLAHREGMEHALISIAKAIEAGKAHAPTFGEYPGDLRYVHLPDYVPYSRAGKKNVSRPEEIKFFGLQGPGEVKYIKGDLRGPAWYQIRRTEQDIPRLEHLLRNVVGTIRMGRFFESIGDKCSRCGFANDCLNTGYEVRGDEKRQLDAALRHLPIVDDGLDAA